MLIPILLGFSEPMQGTHDHATHAGSAPVLTGLTAVGLHTLVMFVVMGTLAIVVYEKLGVMILKRTWINLDLLWAGALVAAGVITLVI